MPKKITFEEFEQKVYNKYGKDNVDLSLIDKDNFNYSDKVKIICKKHNEIKELIPKIFLRKKSNPNIICDTCYREFFKHQQNIKLNEKQYVYYDDLINLCQYKHINIIKTSITTHKNNRIYKNDSIICICNKHGEFKTSYNKILSSKHCGCELCRREYNSKKLILLGENNRKDLINRFINVHGYQYDYSLVDLSGKLKKIKIICPKHGIFEMMPSRHLYGEGCKLCNQDKFNCERRLGELLKQNFPNETIIQQYHGILGKQSLDYYFPKYNIGIEYQGSQHFIENLYYNDIRHNLKHTQELDYQKYLKCKTNNIKIFYFTFSKEFKDIQYFDKVYININELINDINNYIN